MSSLPDVPYMALICSAYPESGGEPTTLLCATLSMELEKGVLPMIPLL